MKKIILFCFIVTAQLLAAGVQADVLLIDPGTSLTGYPVGATYTVGYDFTVGNDPLLVTELGIWDQGQDGLINQHMIGLWDVNGDLLSSQTIPAGTSSTMDGQFRYVALSSPVFLAADTQYVIGASYIDGDADRFLVARTYENANPIFDAAVTPGFSRYSSDPSSMTFPSQSGGTANLGDFGPNMIFEVVPEPSILYPSAGCIIVCWMLSRKPNQMNKQPNSALKPIPTRGIRRYSKVLAGQVGTCSDRMTALAVSMMR